MRASTIKGVSRCKSPGQDSTLSVLNQLEGGLFQGKPHRLRRGLNRSVTEDGRWRQGYSCCGRRKREGRTRVRREGHSLFDAPSFFYTCRAPHLSQGPRLCESQNKRSLTLWTRQRLFSLRTFFVPTPSEKKINN